LGRGLDPDVVLDNSTNVGEWRGLFVRLTVFNDLRDALEATGLSE
jgi:hypothetical protein